MEQNPKKQELGMEKNPKNRSRTKPQKQEQNRTQKTGTEQNPKNWSWDRTKPKNQELGTSWRNSKHQERPKFKFSPNFHPVQELEVGPGSAPPQSQGAPGDFSGPALCKKLLWPLEIQLKNQEN